MATPQKSSYLSRDQSHAPAVEAEILNNWTISGAGPFYFKEYFFSKKKGSKKGIQGRKKTGDRTEKCVIIVFLLQTETPWVWILFSTEEFFLSAHILITVIVEEGASVLCLFSHCLCVLSNKLVKKRNYYYYYYYYYFEMVLWFSSFLLWMSSNENVSGRINKREMSKPSGARSGLQMWRRAPKAVIQKMLPSPTVTAEGREDARIRPQLLLNVNKVISLTPDNRGAYKKSEFSEPRGLHPPIQRMLSSFPWYLVFDIQTACSLCCKLAYSLTPPPASLEQFSQSYRDAVSRVPSPQHAHTVRYLSAFKGWLYSF